MPGFDRTGPQGQGPQTGKGYGPCGRGRGFGRGFCFRKWEKPVELSKEEKTKILKAEKEEIEKELKELEE